MNAQWHEILDQIRRGQRFLIAIHVRPDGDSIGSSLALRYALQAIGKQVVMLRVDEIPSALRFLPGIDDFVLPGEVEGEFDAVLFLDCGGLERVGDAQEVIARAKVKINIDHHLSNSRFGDINYIDDQAAAVGEIVIKLIRDLGVELNWPIAMGIYVALVTDTGSFQFESTSSETHRIAADLLDAGVRPAAVARQVWENKPIAWLRLLQKALSSLKITDNGQISWITISQETLAQTGATASDTEGLVSYARMIDGVEAAALFFEEEPDVIKVSLRSNRWLNVSEVAKQFNGGGHARAAGCVVRQPLERAVEVVVQAMQAAMVTGRNA